MKEIVISNSANCHGVFIKDITLLQTWMYKMVDPVPTPFTLVGAGVERLTVLPIVRIPACLTPVDDGNNSKRRSRGYYDITSVKVGGVRKYNVPIIR